MKKAIEIFNEGFFWDCKKDQIDLEEDYDLVIERVLSHSMSYNRMENFQKLKEIYPLELIQEIAVNSTQIFGNEIIEDIAKFFDLNPKDFYRYIQYDENGNVILKYLSNDK
ncbi:DUF6922 domain-containing protein [Ornithobacterium rhinotracheale]|uniref:DUF6922 domain-containing protein n=1 Tax=Ornithobacterium rhinotracheale TaxID=28251 RepID=UPI003FA42CA2